MNQPGRTCPLRYRYQPEGFPSGAALCAETIYVVGGLYRNVESLRCVLAMKRDEEDATGSRVDLFFNGEFNWFDCDAESFLEISAAMLLHPVLTGNVEADLDLDLDLDRDEDGCGCSYPACARAADFADVRARLAALPMHCSVEVGGQRIGVVHGDPESLSGWSFVWEAMPVPGASRRRDAPEQTSPERIAQYFERAQVCAFASTHTDTAFAQDFRVGGARCLVINNGAAGLPNFKGTGFGVLTRISSRLEVRAVSLSGTTLGSARFDAIAIRYDQAAWAKRFLANWPEGSPGHSGYFKRIAQGPECSVHQANRIEH